MLLGDTRRQLGMQALTSVVDACNILVSRLILDSWALLSELFRALVALYKVDTKGGSSSNHNSNSSGLKSASMKAVTMGTISASSSSKGSSMISSGAVRDSYKNSMLAVVPNRSWYVVVGSGS